MTTAHGLVPIPAATSRGGWPKTFLLCLWMVAGPTPSSAANATIAAEPPQPVSLRQRRQLCHQRAGYYSDDCATASPHCWRLTATDGVNSAEDCQAECAKNSICTYFAFHKHFGPSCDLLPEDAKYASSLPGVVSGDTKCIMPDSPTDCHASAGYVSSEPPQPGIVDLESCKLSCDADPTCLAFSFNVYLRTCAFSTANQTGTIGTYYPWLIGVVSGKRHCDLPPSTLKCNVGYAYWQKGANVTKNVNRADTCQQLCRADPGCTYFTFENTLHVCLRMSGGNVSLWPGWDGVTSGERDCKLSKLCNYRTGSFIGGRVLPLSERLLEGSKVVKGCRKACQMTANCSYFNYDLDLSSCELLDSSAYFESWAVKYVSGKRKCQLPMGETSFCAEDSGAYVNDSVTPLQNLSALECHELCNASSTCRYFSYHLASFKCWLLEYAYRNPVLMGYWSGTRDCQMPRKGSCLVDQGYVLQGVVNNFGATSPMGCLAACKRDPDCRYFTFNVVLRTCALLGPNVTYMDYLPGVISGAPNCSENRRPSKVMLQLKDLALIFFPSLMRSLQTYLGRYMDEATAVDCPAGQANFWGADTCRRCSNGSSRRRGGITRCVPCENGTYNVGLRDDCEDIDVVILREAGRRDLRLVIVLRDHGTDVNSALRNASTQSDLNATETLLKAGANGTAALRRAIRKAIACDSSQRKTTTTQEGGCQRELAALDTLWQARDFFASPKFVQERYNRLLEEALRQGAQSVVKSMVRKHLFSPEDEEVLGRSALHLAAAKGDINASKVLIREAKMTVEHMSKKRLTPIDVALMNAHEREAQMLQGYARSWKEALEDKRTWKCVAVSFLAAAGFWLAMSCLGSSCKVGRRLSGSGASDEDSESSSKSEGEDTEMPGMAKAEKEKAALGPKLLAAQACSPSLTGALVKLQRILGVLANLVFPGTFCQRYVDWRAWLLTLAMLYILPAMHRLGWRTICQKPALIFSFPDCNLLCLRRDRPHRRGHLFFSVARASLLLPLAIFLGGPRFQETYLEAGRYAPSVFGVWYTYSAALERYTPSLAGGGNKSFLTNPTINGDSDLVSPLRWHPAGMENVTAGIPMKLCPFKKAGLAVKHCLIETRFHLYPAMLCWYAFLGFVTYFWCVFSLLLHFFCRERGHSEGSAHAVDLLALEIQRTEDLQRLADLEPANEKLPQVVRAAMRSHVKPTTTFAMGSAAFLMILDIVLDMNTQVTMFVQMQFLSAGVLLWFFFVSLFFELWDGSLFHLYSDVREAGRRGFPPDRTLHAHSRENGFEAFGSLLVSTAALLTALKTPFQFITGILSLLSSVNGLAAYIFQEVDLLGGGAEEEEEEGEPLGESSSTEDGFERESTSLSVRDLQMIKPV